jgi:hypothetical protein
MSFPSTPSLYAVGDDRRVGAQRPDVVVSHRVAIAEDTDAGARCDTLADL